MCESPLRAARDACVAEYGVRSCFRFLGRFPPSSAASLPLTPMGVLVCLGDGAAAEGLDGERRRLVKDGVQAVCHTSGLTPCSVNPISTASVSRSSPVSSS